MGRARAAHLRVDDFVSAQRACLPETFPAHFADEGARAGVHGHVSGQVVVRVKNLQKVLNKNSKLSTNILTSPQIPKTY